MNKFNEEVSHWNEYSHIVINDNLEKCYENILNIMMLRKKGVIPKKNLGEIEKKIQELTK